MDTLRETYLSLKRDAAPGVDTRTWRASDQALAVNLQDLPDRLKRGAYRHWLPPARICHPYALRRMGVIT